MAESSWRQILPRAAAVAPIAVVVAAVVVVVVAVVVVVVVVAVAGRRRRPWLIDGARCRRAPSASFYLDRFPFFLFRPIFSRNLAGT